MKKVFVLLLILVFYYSGHAQKLVGAGKLIQGGAEDGQKLVDAYLLPLNRALMVGVGNSGFNGTHFAHEDYRFSLSLNMTFIDVPNSDKTFNVNELDLQSVAPKDSKDVIAQTAFGDSSVIKLVSKYGLGNLRYFSFNTVAGSERNVMPLPYLNATYQIKNGMLGFQVIPPVVIPQSDIRVWMVGANFNENMSKLLPFIDHLPFDLHLGGGVFLFRGSSDLNVDPSDVIVNIPITNDTKGPYDDQVLNMGYQGVYGNLFATYDLDIFTPFIGVGYSSGSSSFNVEGTYPIYAKSGNFISVRASDIVDPFSSDDSYARMKIEVGGRFDFSRFFAQASYTLANYGGFNGRLGVHF